MTLNQAQESTYKVLALIVTFKKNGKEIFQGDEDIKLNLLLKAYKAHKM